MVKTLKKPNKSIEKPTIKIASRPSTSGSISTVFPQVSTIPTSANTNVLFNNFQQLLRNQVQNNSQQLSAQTQMTHFSALTSLMGMNAMMANMLRTYGNNKALNGQRIGNATTPRTTLGNLDAATTVAILTALCKNNTSNSTASQAGKGANKNESQAQLSKNETHAPAAIKLENKEEEEAPALSTTKSPDGLSTQNGPAGSPQSPEPIESPVPNDSINKTIPAKSSTSNRLPPRNMNRWILLGTFKTEEEMQKVRNKEKVSKRRTEQLKNGVKVRYRCNKWKRTKCAFQMYSFYQAELGTIELFETGVHDHSGRRMIEFELNQRKKEELINSAKEKHGGNDHRPSSSEQLGKLSQEDILSSLLASSGNAMNEKIVINVSPNVGDFDQQKEGHDSFGASDFDQSNPTDCLLNFATARATALESMDDCAIDHNQQSDVDSTGQMDTTDFPISSQLFSLKDDHSRINELLEIASELDLLLAFSNKNECDFIFRPNALLLMKRSLSLYELPDAIVITDRLNEKSMKQERWQKGDWTQFMWALRGKCAKYLCEQPKKETPAKSPSPPNATKGTQTEATEDKKSSEETKNVNLYELFGALRNSMVQSNGASAGKEPKRINHKTENKK